MGIAPDHHPVIISADTHGGASHRTYREYLDSKYHEDFDAWRGQYKNPFKDLQDSVDNNQRFRNWDDELRFSDLEADGVVGEIIFPNTVPPFFPTGALVARPPSPEDFEHRLVGIRTHNRWLADWCAEYADRRAGIAQLFLNDVDEAVKDVEFAKDHGLRGGILLPAVPPDTPHISPVYDPAYDRVWAACQDGDVVVNAHGGTGMPDYGRFPASPVMSFVETMFYSHRTFVQLVMSGVFARFPRLKLVLTEQGGAWVRPLLEDLDKAHARMTSGRIGELGFDTESLPPEPPSYYFENNCWMAVSFPNQVEGAAYRDIGVDRYMWGNDYPHYEGTFPHSAEAIRFAFEGATPDDLVAMLGGNAAEVYGFDVAALQPIADRVAPTVADLLEPLDAIPADSHSHAFRAA